MDKRFKQRGWVCEGVSRLGTYWKVQILNSHEGHNFTFYTVRVLDAPQEEDKIGLTQAWTNNEIDQLRPLGRQTIWSGKGKPSNIIYGECPSCDEDESIFYEGDYICAWCREHLEDGIV